MKRRRIPKHLLIEPYSHAHGHAQKRSWLWWCLAFTTLALSIFLAAAAKARPLDEPQSGVLTLGNDDKTRTPSTLVNTEVSATITGMIATVNYTQHFRNDSDDWVEGVYMFPLPEAAAVQHMEIHIGKRRIIGEIKEKIEAKRIYDLAKSQGKRAALTSQQRPNLFTQRISNIGPREEIKVHIQFLDTARYENGLFEWRLPTTLTPRYIPGKPVSANRHNTLDLNESPSQLKLIPSEIITKTNGWAFPTDQVPDAHLITPPMTNKSSSNTLALEITLNSGIELSEINSLYHDIQIKKNKKKHQVSLSNTNEKMNRDFVLQWQATPDQTPNAAIFTQKQGDDLFAMLMLVPPQKQSTQTLARDIVFIIDTSGSMQGSSIAEAKASLQFALESLSPSDRFNLIEFNSSYSTLFNKTQMASERNIQKASQWVANLQANGGTEMHNALSEAFKQFEDSSSLKQIVFITDGAIGNESNLFKLIENKISDTRLFTVGIGSAPNSYFMKKAAQFGRGTFEYIAHPDDIQANMSRLFDKLNSASSKNIEISWPSNSDVYPKRIGDLYLNEPIVAFAKLQSSPKELLVKGETSERTWENTLSFTSDHSASGISSLWARKKIESIEDKGHTGKLNQNDVKKSILSLALEHKLLSRFTSFVAVDKAPVRIEEERLITKAIPNLVAKGQRLQAVTYPKTATTAEFSFWLGLFIFTILILYKRLKSDM